MNIPQNLLDHRSEPDVRAVIEDIDQDHGRKSMRIGLALWITDTATDAADAAADTATDAADAADTATDAATDAADAAAADDTADAADAAATYRTSILTQLILEETDMRNGLKLIQVPGRYGYSVTRVGWMRRVSGDEFELVNAVTVTRTGDLRSLASLAQDGPKRDHSVSDMDDGVEEVHRLVIRRSRPANEAVWIEHCPKPSDWRDE